MQTVPFNSVLYKQAVEHTRLLVIPCNSGAIIPICFKVQTIPPLLNCMAQLSSFMHHCCYPWAWSRTASDCHEQKEITCTLPLRKE